MCIRTVALVWATTVSWARTNTNLYTLPFKRKEIVQQQQCSVVLPIPDLIIRNQPICPTELISKTTEEHPFGSWFTTLLVVCKVWLEKNRLELHPHFSNSSVSNQTNVIQHHCLRMSDYMIISSPPCWERLPPPSSSGSFTGKNFSGLCLFLFLRTKTVKA